jgi:eukaryotic-like serine/threonine-protein kinase
MTLAPGTRLGSYEVLGALGAGGMGEVYRARDSRLGRTVALKVLPERFFEDEEKRARFEREARLLAAVNHPGIAAIYSFEEIRDSSVSPARHLLTMELVEGVPLSKRMKAGKIPMVEALSIGRDIAAALEAAHAKGIVHRDLKPGNVMISSDGRVKLLDFGLAKAFEKEPASPDFSHSSTVTAAGTEAGVILGTAAYMSPEQACGQRVDARTDVWAFGVVLWELLTGRRLFRGESTSDTLAAVLTEPVNFKALPLSTPRDVRDLLVRCLEREPEKRLMDVGETRRALERAAAGGVRVHVPIGTLAVSVIVLLALAVGGLFFARRRTGVPAAVRAAQVRKPTRIVVLPFENLGAPQDAYFAAGMTEEIISRLANLHGLAVISRTTAIGYDRKGKTIPEIGADLGVDFVLEGTVRCERAAGRESRVRITPQLIQVADDTHVWADRYDRVMADIFAIQSEVAENVVRAMGLKLVPREKTALKTVSTNDMEAYDLYLRGLEMANRGRTQPNVEGALRMFQAAVDRDPRFLQALAQLVKTHLAIYFLYYDRSRERVDRAKDLVDRLAALGPDLAETHIARGYYNYFGLLDYPRALEEFKAALALQPSSSDAHQGIAFILRRQGQWEEAAEEMIKWLELDPRSPATLSQYGQTCVFLRRYAEADRVFALSASFNPQFGALWGMRGWVQVLWRGDAEKAQSLLSEAGAVPGLQDELNFVAYSYYQVGLVQRDFRGVIRRLDAEKREALSNQFYFFPIDLLRGQAQALSGQRDLAARSFKAARHRLEELISKESDDSRYPSALGIACAGLGLREEALRAANRGVELMPTTKDAWRALWRMEDLALVHAMLGQQSEAIERLDFLLSRTGEISAHVLRLDPRWDPLRKNPKFEALLAKYEPKS